MRLDGCFQRYKYWFNISAFIPWGPYNWQAQFHFNYAFRCCCLYRKTSEILHGAIWSQQTMFYIWYAFFRPIQGSGEFRPSHLQLLTTYCPFEAFVPVQWGPVSFCVDTDKNGSKQRTAGVSKTLWSLGRQKKLEQDTRGRERGMKGGRWAVGGAWERWRRKKDKLPIFVFLFFSGYFEPL